MPMYRSNAGFMRERRRGGDHHAQLKESTLPSSCVKDDTPDDICAYNALLYVWRKVCNAGQRVANHVLIRFHSQSSPLVT
jgi:hypothetical protein